MLLALVLLSLFFTMLLFPETVFRGACDGLLLWYQILIPTLFPYLIVTGLLLKTDGAAIVSRLLFRPFHLLFGTSFYGSFAVLSGFLCGYPMGAKIIADLLLQGKISLEEASYLLSFCNNASPSFVITFLVLNTIHQKAFCIPALLLLHLLPSQQMVSPAGSLMSVTSVLLPRSSHHSRDGIRRFP